MEAASIKSDDDTVTTSNTNEAAATVPTMVQNPYGFSSTAKVFESKTVATQGLLSIKKRM